MNCTLQLVPRRFPDQEFMWFSVNFSKDEVEQIDFDEKTLEAASLLESTVSNSVTIDTIKPKNRFVTWIFGESVKKNWDEIVSRLGKTCFDATISPLITEKRFEKSDGISVIACLQIECPELKILFNHLMTETLDDGTPLLTKNLDTVYNDDGPILHQTLARCFIKN